MSIFEALHRALSNRDTKAYIDLLDDDYRFVRHRSATVLKKDQMEHHVVDFEDGNTEAVLAVHLIKNGKIIRTETGVTSIDS